jgi:hypothetical protein
MAVSENWKEAPDDHDFPAAADYLSLVLPQEETDDLVRRLRTAPLLKRRAKDLLRASGLPVLKADNYHVAKDLAKVRKGERLSPVLLVRGRLDAHVPLTIADGYHRICASYHLAEDSDIPCRIVDLSKPG